MRGGCLRACGVAAALLLAACGGGGGGGGEAGGGTAAPATEAAPLRPASDEATPAPLPPPSTVPAGSTGTLTLGGSISGLAGTVTLRNSDGQTLVASSDGAFVFDDRLAAGSAYAVSVASQPAGQQCVVGSGTGTANANVSSVVVTCTTLVVVPPPPPAPAAPANLAVVGYGVKRYALSWDAVNGASTYALYEDPDGAGPRPAAVIAGNLATTSYDHVVPVLLHERLNATYTVRACNAGGCSGDSGAVQPDVQRAIGYFKASNTQASDNFGVTIALSADGSTLAVGAHNEASAATGVDGDQASNAASAAGAVYVFRRNGSTWAQEAYLKASNTRSGASFGRGVALSSDGSYLAVGAPSETSNAVDVDGNQADTSMSGAGAVYVFARASGAWTQQAYVKSHATAIGEGFGYDLALSGDATTLAVGASGAFNSRGRIHVYGRAAANWTYQATLAASNGGDTDNFGRSVALSSDGSVLVTGATGEDGNGSSLFDNSLPQAGAAYVFRRTSGYWSQEAYLKAGNPKADTFFGVAVAISGDGGTIAVGAPVENSSATGVGGDPSSTAAASAGAVYVFVKGSGAWSQQAYVKATNTGAYDRFGDALRLSADGNVLAIAAPDEGGGATGIGGDPANDSAANAGAVYVLRRSGGSWAHEAYLKASNAGASSMFGFALGLSADGNTLASSAPLERSNATGIGGDAANTSAAGAGAVYLY